MASNDAFAERIARHAPVYRSNAPTCVEAQAWPEMAHGLGFFILFGSHKNHKWKGVGGGTESTNTVHAYTPYSILHLYEA